MRHFQDLYRMLLTSESNAPLKISVHRELPLHLDDDWQVVGVRSVLFCYAKVWKKAFTFNFIYDTH